MPRFSSAYLGVCAPAACSAAEVQDALARVLNAAAPAAFRTSLTPEMCRQQRPEPTSEGLGAWLARYT